MSRDTELLEEIRDLLLLLAEPAIASRDEKLRGKLLEIVGTSAKKAAAVKLMDGSKSQSEIVSQSGCDAGNLSRLIKSLRNENLIKENDRCPKLGIVIPSTFFDH